MIDGRIKNEKIGGMIMNLYAIVKDYKRKYPLTIGWRLKSHCKIIERHLNPGEIVNFAFVGQKTDSAFDFMSTYVVVLTNRRILLAQKRLLFGYLFTAVTPDLFNDLKVRSGLIWAKIYIDTAKEFITISKIQKSSSDLIETNITEYMMAEKKKYGLKGYRES